MTATATHRHLLYGCRPEPLASYLKALGILRLLGEQADGDASGWWQGGTFAVETGLDDDGLRRFLLDGYRPTPVVSPWNSSSGFGPEGKDDLHVIEASTDPRLAEYRQAIGASRAVLAEAEREGWSLQKDKKRIVWRCRARLPDPAVAWLDAAVVLVSAGSLAYPPILGTGGNLGRLDLSWNFAQRVLDVLGMTLRRGADPAGWLEDALWDAGTSAGLRKASPGQFDPGAAGGANSGPEGAADAVLNPWDYVLLVEGAVLFAAGSSRRLALGAQGRAAVPFTADSAAAGYASAAPGEAVKGELWAPLWDRPATLREVRALLAEGRADWRGRHARSGLDMAKAAGSLGVDRGLSGFSRYVIAERFGQTTLAVPAGRVEVRAEPSRAAVLPLADLDDWLDRVRDGARRRNPPAPVVSALRALDAAAFEAVRLGSGPGLCRVLVETARLEAVVGRASGFRDRARVSPVRGLVSTHWVPALLGGAPIDADGAELRLALSLSSLRDLDPEGRRVRSSLRTLLRPVAFEKGRPDWSAVTPVSGLGVRSVTAVLAEAHAHRVVELRAARRQRPERGEAGPEDVGPGVPTSYERGSAAALADVAALAAGRLDEALLSDLLAGCLLLDWRDSARLGAPDVPLMVAPALAVVGPFFAEQPHAGTAPDAGGGGLTAEPGSSRSARRLVPESTWPALLAAGRVEPVMATALRRLRMAGLDPVAGPPAAGAGRVAVGPDAARLLGAALLCRLTMASREVLLRISCPRPETQSPAETDIPSEEETTDGQP
jgi:CRISPR-associated protein Csx17